VTHAAKSGEPIPGRAYLQCGLLSPSALCLGRQGTIGKGIGPDEDRSQHRVATRYEQHGEDSAAMITLAAIMLWLSVCEHTPRRSPCAASSSPPFLRKEPPMLNHITHVALIVGDIRAMTAFYRDVCGMQVRGGGEVQDATLARVLGYDAAHVHFVMLAAAGDRARLELIHYVSPTGEDGHVPKNALGASHIGFDVDDLDETYRRLSRAGVRFVNPPTTTQSTRTGQRQRVCYAQDPEGNWLEFWETSGQG
jgi:catechol 2,3-dioxygenase-like lactoylglutathione lyase family enzyme